MKNILLIAVALFLFKSCSKADQNTQENTQNTEEALVQKPLMLQNSNGDQLSVTYFSEGEVVAVKIEKAGEMAQKLLGKTLNASGNPIFTNENYMWEFANEGQAGILSDKSGATVEYFVSDKEN